MAARLDRSQLVIAGALLLGGLVPSCGGDRSPTSSTTTTTLPAPTPTPTASSGCSLGPGSVTATCERTVPQLSRPIETAIDLLVREKPHLVDLNSQRPANTDQYKVRDEEAFLDTMVENLRRQLLCAERDGDYQGSMRIVVKNSNAFSETYDVLDNGYILRRQAAYVTTCTPAAFPIERTSADVPPAGTGCGRPYPPPITRFSCKVHLRAPEYHTVDATPKVGPNVEYCNAIGFVGQSICPVRPEGAEDRAYCENWRVGRAQDTGRWGPTWTNGSGEACTGPDSNCSNTPDNQYQVRVYRSGQVHASAENGAECLLMVDR
jgi:hypothetical protein